MSRNIFTNERNLVAYPAGHVIMQPGEHAYRAAAPTADDADARVRVDVHLDDYLWW